MLRPLRLAVRSPPFQGGGTSSNLVGVTKLKRIFGFFLIYRAISSAGRAPALQAGGRRFEPVIAHQKKRRLGRKKVHSGFCCASFFCSADTLMTPMATLLGGV